MSRRSLGALLTAGSVAVLAGCGAAGPTAAPATGGGPAGPISVRVADAVCEVSTAHAPAGMLTFVVTNAGTTVTGFSLSAAGDRVLGEIGNIDPGRTRQLVVEVPEGGTYTTACRSGSGGDGIRAPFTVTGAATREVARDPALAVASGDYRRYVAAQVAALIPATQQFADAVRAGDVDAAKRLFAVTRASYERIESVTDTFPELDARIDATENDRGGPAGWTGFHRLEKDLWVDGLRPDSAQVAAQLVTDVQDLRARTASLPLGPAEVAGNAIELVDGVVTGKITGQEDRYSDTELWDAQANVDGARAAVAALRPVIDARDPTLGPLLDARFAAVDALLARHRTGDGFRGYAELTQNDLKALTDAIDALSEPISRVAGVVTS